MVICVSRTFCSTDQEKRETARSLQLQGTRCDLSYQLEAILLTGDCEKKRWPIQLYLKPHKLYFGDQTSGRIAFFGRGGGGGGVGGYLKPLTSQTVKEMHIDS